jgi:hypothetical protein
MSLNLPAGFEQFVKDSNRGKVELNQFSKVFFPMFVAYFAHQDTELSRWFQYTKTKGYEWVDVIEGGEVIFSVPPVFQSITLDPGKSLKQDPADILKIASIKDQTIPGAGNRHIRENITNVIDMDDDFLDGQTEFMDAWFPIFKHYNYTLENEKTKPGATPSDFNPGDFDDYDDL